MRYTQRFSVLVGMASIVLVASCVVPTAPPPRSTTTPSHALVNSQWYLTNFVESGNVKLLVPGSTVTVEFGANGRLGGTGGCNTYSGAYAVDGSTLVISNVVSTLRTCADVATNRQEQNYFAALRSTDTFKISGNELNIRYGGGDSTMHFFNAAATVPQATPESSTRPATIELASR